MTVSATPGPETGGQRSGASGRAAPTPPGPSTDCVADHDGSLTFTFASQEAPPGGDAVLLRRRSGDAVADTVGLPLRSAGRERWCAVLPPTIRLAEGRWDLFVAGDGAPRRLRPGVNDLRTLVDQRPSAAAPGVAVRIPYATKYRNLSLRSWERDPHVEAEEVWVGPEGVRLTGRLYGAELSDGGALEARARGGAEAAVRYPVTDRGRTFAVWLPCRELAAHRAAGADTAVWDLWLRPGGDDTPPARIARLLDDILDKSGIVRYPSLSLPAVAVTPRFTADNDLALQLRWAAR